MTYESYESSFCASLLVFLLWLPYQSGLGLRRGQVSPSGRVSSPGLARRHVRRYLVTGSNGIRVVGVSE